MNLIYLACPYSHEDMDVMVERVELATKCAAELMENGNNVFSPLTHSHYIANYLEDTRLNHRFWLSRDFQIISKCDELHVLCLPGWDKSTGVSMEISLAEGLGMNVYYHEPREV